MMEFVNGKDAIPYIIENNPAMFETTNQNSSMVGHPQKGTKKTAAFINDVSGHFEISLDWLEK
jgi:hypothetical protein